MLTYSSAFKVTTVNAAFNETIETAAKNGSVAHALLSAIVVDYGFQLSDKPAMFIKSVNADFLTGAGKASARVLVQCLHQCASAIIAAGKVKTLPVLLALPAWANPADIKAKSDASKAKAKATKAAKVTAPTITGAVLDVEGDAARTIAAIKAQALKPATLDALRVALGLAVPAPM